MFLCLLREQLIPNPYEYRICGTEITQPQEYLRK